MRRLSLKAQRAPAKNGFNMLSADVIRGRCGVWPAYSPPPCEQCSEPANTAQLTVNNRCQRRANMPSTISSPCCHPSLARRPVDRVTCPFESWTSTACPLPFPMKVRAHRSMHEAGCRAVSRRTITPSTAVADLPCRFACRQLLQSMTQRRERYGHPFLLKRLSNRGRPNGAWARGL